jgi:hypothetical protein
VPLINARMNGRCLDASGSYNIFCTKIKLKFFVLIHYEVQKIFFSLLVLEGVIIESLIDPRSRISLPRLIIFYY